MRGLTRSSGGAILSTCRWCQRRHPYGLRTSAMRSPFRSTAQASIGRIGSSVAMVAGNPTTSDAELQNERPSVPGNAPLSDPAFTDGSVRRLAPQGRVAETLVLG